MCIIDELISESLSTKNILKYIDSYSIYSKYIGAELELNARYSSPLRKGDDNPSFSLFRGRRGTDDTIFFKDAATTYKGDVFEFVKILMSDKTHIPTFEQVLQRIDIDFQLGLYVENASLPKLELKQHLVIPVKERFSINITSHKIGTKIFSSYWEDKYDIYKEVRKMYNCTQVQVIHYSSKSTTNKFQSFPKSLCIAYQIGGRYKLYFPFEAKKDKFRNDFPENWIEGYLQLKREKDFVIITKAMKEVMFFRQHFDWDTVAGKSENTMIPKHLMDRLFKDFKKVYIWLDGDEAGIKAQEKYIEKYPNLIPITTDWEQKDCTDRYESMKELGEQEKVLNEIKQLIN